MTSEESEKEIELTQSEFENMANHHLPPGKHPITEEQLDHTDRVLEQFSDLFKAKQLLGQVEHGGNIWTKPMVGNAILEATDMVSYLFTLQRQLEVLFDTSTEVVDTLREVGRDELANRVENLAKTLCHRRVTETHRGPSTRDTELEWADEVVATYSTD